MSAVLFSCVRVRKAITDKTLVNNTKSKAYLPLAKVITKQIIQHVTNGQELS